MDVDKRRKKTFSRKMVEEEEREPDHQGKSQNILHSDPQIFGIFANPFQKQIFYNVRWSIV